MPNNLIVTEHAQFYRVTLRDGTNGYFPADGPTSRDLARAADVAGDPPIVAGFGVYDTAVSTTYAVETYPTREQADEHKSSQTETKPETVFENSAEPEPTEVKADMPAARKPTAKAMRAGSPFKKRT